jgi:hypothetical protein
MTTAVAGAPVPIVANGRSTLPSGVSAVTLAFATGECGLETWDGTDPREVVAHTIPSLVAAGVGYIVSTGGQAGTFTCASDADMEAFVARYDSPGLIGFDFDIERGQSDEVLHDLVRAVRSAQARRPWLRISVTLATWAASDGSRASVNPDGARVLAAFPRRGRQRLLRQPHGDGLRRRQPGELRGNGRCLRHGTLRDAGDAESARPLRGAAGPHRAHADDRSQRRDR